MKDAALKLALDALEEAWYHVGTFQPTEKAIDLYDEARTTIKEALAQPEQEQNNTYVYASNLAKTIWQKHYMKESPKFALLDTTEGVLTQIDNMTCGLVREKPAQQEPTGMLHIDRLDKWLDASLKERKAQRTWVDLTEDEMDKVRQSMGYNECMSAGEYAKLVQIATQTKLKEKNNG